MPNSRSLRLVAFLWLLRAWALRGCWYVIFAAVFSSNRSEAGCSLSHQDRTNAATAVWSWHTVNSWFFPPFLPHRAEEQITDRRQHQASLHPQITPPLLPIHPNLAPPASKTTPP